LYTHTISKRSSSLPLVKFLGGMTPYLAPQVWSSEKVDFGWVKTLVQFPLLWTRVHQFTYA